MAVGPMATATQCCRIERLKITLTRKQLPPLQRLTRSCLRRAVSTTVNSRVYGYPCLQLTMSTAGHVYDYSCLRLTMTIRLAMSSRYWPYLRLSLSKGNGAGMRGPAARGERDRPRGSGPELRATVAEKGVGTDRERTPKLGDSTLSPTSGEQGVGRWESDPRL